ncbi:MAG: ATPase [Roseburia sp.]
MLKERQHLDEQIQSLQAQLKDFPDGDLLCAKNGVYTKWYLSNGANPIYLSKRNRKTAEILATKKYKSLLLQELLQERDAIDQYLNAHNKNESKSTSLLADSSGYKELLTSYFHSFSTELQQWCTAPYEYNTNHPEHLIHNSISGHKVRSKSESLIANLLYTNKIPYRYECALHFENYTLFPDFTIRHPKTLKTFYWEHFGMMDQPSYCEHTYNKLKLYSSHGIIPSIHLITTYETSNHPLDSEKIQQIIQEYFLCDNFF